MGDIVLSAFLTGGTDPRRTLQKLGFHNRPPHSLDDHERMLYIAPLYRSVHAHEGLQGVLLHDSLSDDFVKRHTTDQFRFSRVQTSADRPSHEQRWEAFRDYLRGHSLIRRVFITDANDSGLTAHVFRWWDALPVRDDAVLVGEEHVPYGKNPWFKDGCAVLPREYGELLLKTHARTQPLAVGTWAARREDAADILAGMVEQIPRLRAHIASLNPPVKHYTSLDMYTFAWTVLRGYASKLATFRMAGDRPDFPGVYLHHHQPPMVHDRMAALLWLDGGQVGSDLSGEGYSWEEIEGWFDWEAVYEDAANRASSSPTKSVLVELGCWLGKSTAYMGRALKHRGLTGDRVEFYAIDTWRGTKDSEGMQSLVKRHNGNVFPFFKQNMERCGVAEFVRPIQMDSADAAEMFADGEVDLVFIDADHSYEGITRDLKAWLPKLKPGTGVIAGHDCDWPGVRKAINEMFRDTHRIWGRTWIVDGGK